MKCKSEPRVGCVQMLSICDVVLNHTANETAWLRAQPAASYNCRGCPHLRPAALLDAALARLTADTAAARLLPDVPATVTTHQHIEVHHQTTCETTARFISSTFNVCSYCTICN